MTVSSSDPVDPHGPVTRSDILGIKASVDQLVKGQQQLAATNVWRRRGERLLPWLGGGAVVILAVVLVLVLLLRASNARLAQTQHDLSEQARCLGVLAAASADRTGALAPLAAERTQADRALNVARDNLLKLALDRAPREQIVAASKVYLAALATDNDVNTRYDEASKAHPPPKPSEQACLT